MIAETAGTADRVLALVRLRCRRLATWTEQLRRGGGISPDQGRTITGNEVIRRLSPHTADADESAFFAQMPSVATEIEDAERHLADDPFWRGMIKAFALTRDEADLLALAIAVELDPGLSRVYAYLHDDAGTTQATVWLAARLADRKPTPIDTINLRRWLLALPDDVSAADRLLTPWQADPVLPRALHGSFWTDPALADALELIRPEDIDTLSCLHPKAFAELGLVQDPSEYELVGPDGIGRQTLAAQYAASSGRSLVAIDLQVLADSDLPTIEGLIRGLRLAALSRCLAYFRNGDIASQAEWDRALRLGVPFLRGVRHPSGKSMAIILRPLPAGLRRELWRSLSDAPPPDWVSSRRPVPEEIVAAALHPDRPKRPIQRPDSTLLNLLPTPYDWDDLILSAEIKAQLHALEAQIRLRWSVYEDWGFARLTHLGMGISALFGGPSGTGKTMAAQVLARALGLDLLRVDLAGVVNKYIGETEKRLREVFDACEDSDAILFFDEADALFGNRTQVKDAHDRFANIEIDYLLQRIERFDGIAILATNRRQDLDPAFVRRLRFVIEFMPPRSEERLALWRHALKPTAPDGQHICDEIDWKYLSERLQMTGAEIKSTAVNAAFLARAHGTRITMAHVIAAAQRELAKQGLHLRAPFQERTSA
jgi:MoxR-like ATPase